MFVVCAWCGKNLGQKEPLSDKRTSHGMCPDCEKKYDDELTKKSVISNAVSEVKKAVESITSFKGD